MGDIIEFPTKAVRDRKKYEGLIALLISKTASRVVMSEGMREELRNRLTKACLSHQQELTFSIDIPPSSVSIIDRDAFVSSLRESINVFDNLLQSFTHRLLIERLNLEAELYVSKLST